jgi:hypothetical protein
LPLASTLHLKKLVTSTILQDINDTDIMQNWIRCKCKHEQEHLRCWGIKQYRSLLEHAVMLMCPWTCGHYNVSLNMWSC